MGTKVILLEEQREVFTFIEGLEIYEAMVLLNDILIQFHKDILTNIFFEGKLSQQQKPMAYLLPFTTLIFLSLPQPLFVSPLIIEYPINQCHFDSYSLLQRIDLRDSYYLIVDL